MCVQGRFAVQRARNQRVASRAIVGFKVSRSQFDCLVIPPVRVEVYRARDTKLKRDVAIKILPDEFSRDPERVGGEL